MSGDKKVLFTGTITAAKVAKLISGLRKDWDRLEQQELAERIVDLQDQMTVLKKNGQVISLEKKAEDIHFDFVFPVSLELKKTPYSFAKEIDKLAKQILKSQSVDPFYQLNSVQQQEILRRCA